MTDKSLDRVEELFHRARGMAPAERAGFLDEQCGDDLGLRGEIESLLAHADGATGDLRPPAARTDATLVRRGPVSEGPGTRIGPYKILQQIGEGGFGVVYMAEQLEPVRRKIALKIIKLGMDTKQVIARFEAERQALALMDHPNIARVLDAGATETGRPYFVMELVRGIPITEYCDGRKLATRQRLELFTDVCQAIQHAHQKGIIHRDIKPSNILVTLHDSRPVPKVIDFGIAKATDHRLTEKTLFTEFRQFIGTPEYMSPDQAEISGLDVDTRSDVYSLGVLLYELLTGTTPFDSTTLRKAAYEEIQRIIREEEPPLPSTRVGTLAGRLEEIAQQRGAEASALGKMIRGDLDWIVMKAMEKDRTRRYQTASDLAADIERHLRSEPVEAGPPSVLYKMRKFVRRHRIGVGATALIALALLATATVSLIGFVHSRAVSRFLTELAMQVELGPGSSDAAGVDEIIERGEALFGDDHAVIGTLLSTRASTLATAGRLELAIEAQREALGFFRSAYAQEHGSVAAALSALGQLLQDNREYVEAEATYRESVELHRRLFGPQDRLTADALARLTELILMTEHTTRHDEIRSLWRSTIEAYVATIGPEHKKTVLQQCYRAKWLHDNGYSEEAGPLLDDVVDVARRVLGKDIVLFMVLNAQAQHRLFAEKDTAAVPPIVDEMVEIGQALWGPMNSTIASLMFQTLGIHSELGQTDDAGRTLERYVAARRESDWRPPIGVYKIQHQLGRAVDTWLSDHPDVGREFFMLNVADARALDDEKSLLGALVRADTWLSGNGFVEDGLAALRELEKRAREADPVPTDELGGVLTRIGERETTLGRTDDARRAFEEAESLLLAVEDASKLVQLYEAWGKPEQADAWRDGN